MNGLAMDWLSNALYMVDSLNGNIIVCDGYKINICKNLITGLYQPVGVAVYPQKGYEFSPFSSVKHVHQQFRTRHLLSSSKGH